MISNPDRERLNFYNFKPMKKIISLATVCLAVAAMVGFTGCKPAKKQIGLQLYSVAQDMSNVEASIQKVAEAGYNVVETLGGDPGCFGMDPASFKALCDKYGISIISTHASIGLDPNDEEGTMNKWRKLFEALNVMGAKYCVIPGYGLGSNLQELQGVCDYFNKVGKLAKEYGLLLGYHNHSHEYKEMEGQVIWEYMVEHTDHECVFFQMDVYWTTMGGKNPVDYLKKYPDRIKMLHIKDDMVIGDSGKVDFEAIFNQFYANGYKDFVVEQEMPRGPEGETDEARFARMWDGVTKSAAYLEAAPFVK